MLIMHSEGRGKERIAVPQYISKVESSGAGETLAVLCAPGEALCFDEAPSLWGEL